MQPHPEHPTTAFRVRAIDWAAPAILALGAYGFLSLTQIVNAAHFTQMTISPSSLAYGTVGLIILAAAFGFAPAKSTRTRLIGAAFAAGGLGIALVQPTIVDSWLDASYTWPITQDAERAHIFVQSLFLASLMAGWFTLRGFPKSIHFFLLATPPAVALLLTIRVYLPLEGYLGYASRDTLINFFLLVGIILPTLAIVTVPANLAAATFLNPCASKRNQKPLPIGKYTALAILIFAISVIVIAITFLTYAIIGFVDFFDSLFVY